MTERGPNYQLYLEVTSNNMHSHVLLFTSLMGVVVSIRSQLKMWVTVTRLH